MSRSEFQPPDDLSTEEAAELANVLPQDANPACALAAIAVEAYFGKMTLRERDAKMTALIDGLQADAYAEGRKDQAEEFAALLPETYYMDPPDGGSATVLEQFQRVAEDARKWREQQARIERAIECEKRCEG